MISPVIDYQDAQILMETAWMLCNFVPAFHVGLFTPETGEVPLGTGFVCDSFESLLSDVV